MTRWSRSHCAACCVVAGFLVFAPRARAQTNPLGAARDLYAAAAYDEALGALNPLRSSARRDDIGLIEQYRAFCLLALGRSAEADAAIEAAVAAAPFAQPAETDCSPSVRSTFREVRRRVLPAVVEREYSDARAAFDRKDPTAADRFRRVLALIADPDLKDAANEPKFSSLRTLATDFLVLTTPKAQPRVVSPLPAQPVQSPPAALPPPPDPAHVYSAEAADVTPPSVVRQSFAPMADVFALRPGAVEIVIDELGVVVSATTRLAVNSAYDRLAIATAKTWRYRPAVRNGVAVKYRMIVPLQLAQKH